MKAAAFLVCCTSCICSFIAALLLILGSWAAKIAPSYIHRQFSTWFLGTSTSATLITCMVMREKLRSSPERNQSILSLTEHYRCTLILSVFGPLGDLILGRSSAIGIENFWGYEAAAVMCFLVNGVTGAAFSYYAFGLGGPLLKYMYRRGSRGNALPPVAPHVSAVVSALMMNVFFIFLNGLVCLSYAPLYEASHTPPVLIQIFCAGFALSRFGQFYWLVRTIPCCLHCLHFTCVSEGCS